MYCIKKKYIDYNGNEREEEFLFHMSKADVIKWLTVDDLNSNLTDIILKLAKGGKGKSIMEEMEKLMKLSYGEKSADGRRFDKTEEIWQNFKSTEAFSEIFTELVTDGKKSAEFVNGIMPKELTDGIEQVLKENPDAISDELKDYLPDGLISDTPRTEAFTTPQT